MADKSDAEILRLTLTSEGYQYDIYPIQRSNRNQSKEVFSIAPPGLSPENNVLLGVAGMQADIEIRGFLWNDGEDRSNGTAPVGKFSNDTVATLSEQREWLQDYIHAPAFSAKWELDHVTGGMYDGLGVFVNRVDCDTLNSQSPKWLEVRIGLIVGQSVG